MSITKETQRESYNAIFRTAASRRQVILDILGDRQMTAPEIAEALVNMGYAPHYERNFAAPRLTELKSKGLVEVVGKRKSPISGRNVRIWARTNRS